MSHMRVDEVRGLLPDLEELRPLLDRVIATSAPDPERRWSTAGELETVGSRVVRLDEVEEGIPAAVERVRAELMALYAAVTAALRALERGDRREAADAFLRAGEAEERVWRMERAEAWALAAYKAVEGERDRRPGALALRRAARAARGRGRLPDAAARYEEAYGVALASGDVEGAVTAAIGRGNVDVDRGLWSRAGGWYRRALELLGEEPSGPTPDRWHAYQNLSIVARRAGDLEESRAWLVRAEEVARTLGDEAALVEVENGWGMWALVSDDAREAERRFRRALAAATDPKSLVTVSVNLGHALLAQGRTVEAGEAGRDAEVEALRAGVVVKLPEVYRLLGEVAAVRGHADAFVFHERALEIIEAWALPAWERAETLEAYARLAERDGDEELARARRREADALRRELSTEEDHGAPPPHEERAP